ncbi:MAG: aspartate kinase [Chitinophagaceae bacterium]
MKILKFGGASISTVERIKNISGILKNYHEEQLVIVISAVGKTTNALEKVASAFFEGDKQTALNLFAELKKQHLSLLSELTEETESESSEQLINFFTEIEWLLHDQPIRNYDYYYDQIVCVGELLSSTIVSYYLNKQGIANGWIDVRDLFRTDNNFRDAHIDWSVTTQKVTQAITFLLNQNNIIITQGFIGATDENESTTLGREGSDYTAAVFANILNAASQTIWKDVPGVMNADPKQFPDARLIKELNYKEVIEMAYYGAQVIHPKTIKPLQNKSIPLYVKSFINPDAEGTCIHNNVIHNLPPIIVYKDKQVLVQLISKDFSFVGEHLTAEIYKIFGAIKTKPNLTQNTAISLMCVLDDHPQKVEEFALRASEYFDVQVQRDLRMLTIRHFTKELFDQLTTDKNILLRQQTAETIQVLMH